MVNKAALVGLIGGILAILLWIVFTFFNPYSAPPPDSISMTFFVLFLPAVLALFAAKKANKTLMLIAFIWALPFSLYMSATPGIFALFSLSCTLYLLSYLFSLKKQTN